MTSPVALHVHGRSAGRRGNRHLHVAQTTFGDHTRQAFTQKIRSGADHGKKGWVKGQRAKDKIADAAAKVGARAAAPLKRNRFGGERRTAHRPPSPGAAAVPSRYPRRPIHPPTRTHGQWLAGAAPGQSAGPAQPAGPNPAAAPQRPARAAGSAGSSPGAEVISPHDRHSGRRARGRGTESRGLGPRRGRQRDFHPARPSAVQQGRNGNQPRRPAPHPRPPRARARHDAHPQPYRGSAPAPTSSSDRQPQVDESRPAANPGPDDNPEAATPAPPRDAHPVRAISTNKPASHQRLSLARRPHAIKPRERMGFLSGRAVAVGVVAGAPVRRRVIFAATQRPVTVILCGGETFEDGGLSVKSSVEPPSTGTQTPTTPGRRTFPSPTCFFAIVITEASISLTALARLARSVDAALSAAAAAAAAASLRIWVSSVLPHQPPIPAAASTMAAAAEARTSFFFSAQPVGLPHHEPAGARSSRVIGSGRASHRCPSQYRFPRSGGIPAGRDVVRFTCHSTTALPHVLSGQQVRNPGVSMRINWPAP